MTLLEIARKSAASFEQWWQRWRPRPSCRHDFIENAVAKRFCTKCGEEQWLFSLPNPSEHQPSLQWKTMDRGRRRGQR